MSISSHRPAPAPFIGPAKQPVEQRVKAGRKQGKAVVKQQEAARKQAGKDMAGFGGLAGVAQDRERARQKALDATGPFVTRLADEKGGSSSRSGAGGSSYAGIVKSFTGYRRALLAADLAGQTEQLAVLGGKVPLWLNDPQHRGQDPVVTARRAVLQDLADVVLQQQAALARQQGQERYLASTVGGTRMHYEATEGKDAAVPKTYPGRFETVTGPSRVRAADALHGLRHTKANSSLSDESEARFALFEKTAKDHGLTAAETTALFAYTDANYYLINPSTADSESWLAATLTRPDVPSDLKLTALQLQDPETVRDLIREGSGHGSVAMQALAKLPPFQGTTYRAQARNLSEEASLRLDVGAVHTLPSLTSTTKLLARTADFAYKATKEQVLIIWVYQDLGKDIELFSFHSTEKEVLASIGDRVRITSVTQLDKRSAAWAARGDVEKYAHGYTKRAGKVLVVRAVAVGAPAPTPQQARWARTAPSPK